MEQIMHCCNNYCTNKRNVHLAANFTCECENCTFAEVNAICPRARVCQTFHKRSRIVDVDLKWSNINKCNIAVRRKMLCLRVRSKKMFLKGNKSSLQHRWWEVLSPRTAARWRKGPFQLKTVVTSPLYERWVRRWQAAMKTRRQIHETPVKGAFKQPLTHGSRARQRWRWLLFVKGHERCWTCSPAWLPRSFSSCMGCCCHTVSTLYCVLSLTLGL